MVQRVGDIQIAVGIHLAGSGLIELRGASLTAIAAVAGRTDAGHRLDRPILRNAQHAMISGIGDIHAAGAIRAETSRPPQRDQQRRRALNAKARRPGARNRPNLAVGADLANPVIVRIGDHQIAKDVHRHAHRSVERRHGSQRPFTACGSDACAGYRAHGPLRRHLSHTLGARIGDVQVAAEIHRESGRQVEARCRGRESIADRM